MLIVLHEVAVTVRMSVARKRIVVIVIATKVVSYLVTKGEGPSYTVVLC